MKIGELLKLVQLMQLKPKADNPKSKTPCSKCVGLSCGCVIANQRSPDQECGAWAEVGKNNIEYKDGSGLKF